jgi:hypothetical protein
LSDVDAAKPFVQKQNTLVLCVIDGNRTLFSVSLVTQGLQGGHQAAQQLTTEISRFLSGENVQMLAGQLSFWVTVYLNKTGLLKAFLDQGIGTQEQFDSFWVGFSQASPRFSVIDVGDGLEAASGKMRGRSNDQLVIYDALMGALRTCSDLYSFPTNLADIFCWWVHSQH